MKRFHVHVAVRDLEGSKAFHSRLFGAEPAVVKHDKARWMIENPRITFAIPAGRERLVAADAALEDEPGANRCYAR